jgi:hypothetical protein
MVWEVCKFKLPTYFDLFQSSNLLLEKIHSDTVNSAKIKDTVSDFHDYKILKGGGGPSPMGLVSATDLTYMCLEISRY